MKKKLFALDYKNNKVICKEGEYDVSKGKYGISVTQSGDGWFNIPQAMYNRIYGENPKSIASNRKWWLENVVLPDKQAELDKVANEISALDDYILTQ